MNMDLNKKTYLDPLHVYDRINNVLRMDVTRLIYYSKNDKINNGLKYEMNEEYK
jgi:hypothetical protein